MPSTYLFPSSSQINVPVFRDPALCHNVSPMDLLIWAHPGQVSPRSDLTRFTAALLILGALFWECSPVSRSSHPPLQWTLHKASGHPQNPIYNPNKQSLSQAQSWAGESACGWLMVRVRRQGKREKGDSFVMQWVRKHKTKQMEGRNMQQRKQPLEGRCFGQFCPWMTSHSAVFQCMPMKVMAPWWFSVTYYLGVLIGIWDFNGYPP